MTVAELVAKLQEFPAEMRVVAHDGEYEDFWDIKDIYLIRSGLAREGLQSHEVLKLSPFDDGKSR